ncbi:MAG: hypothetical protein MUE97_04070 [Phycisphaerales bacterium]|jgi:hypothetical protein|nr:hypothetical protein [Phycisphaerales bacterium]
MNRALSVVALAGLVVGLSSFASAQTILTQWNFNSTVGTTAPSTGAGTASLVGGATATFASGNASGGSSDPVTDATDFGWNTSTYPTVVAGTNETVGVQFLASTVGYQDITVSWDQRHSNSNSRFWAFFYTIDAGATWTRLSVSAANANPGITPAGGAPASTAGLFGPAGTFSAFDIANVTGAGDDWFNGRSVNLTGIAGVNNNPNFGFRVLASFGDGTTYLPSGTGNYAGTGTARFDMATVTGTLIPTPGAVALLGLGGLVAGRRRR